MNTSCLARTLLPAVFAVVTSFGCSSTTTGPSTGSGTSGSSATSGGPGDSSASASLDGSYAGKFIGDDSGPVTMTVAGDKIDVVATVSGKGYPASGAVAEGGAVTFGLGVGAGITVTFDGKFAGGKGSGTWKSSAATKGTWSVSK